MNLLGKFSESNSLLILYMRDGKPHRTMVLLSSFEGIPASAYLAMRRITSRG